METVEDGANVWSPEARQAVNNRDHSCLPIEEKISGQNHENISKEGAKIDRFQSDSLTVGTPPQPAVATPQFVFPAAVSVTTTTTTKPTTTTTTTTNQPRCPKSDVK